MNPGAERLEELAALCAAGAATATERAELESIAAQDPDLRDLMRGYADAASLLALDLAPLPPPAGALDLVRRRISPGDTGAPPVGRMPGSGGDVIPLASRRRGPVVIAMVVPLAAAAAFAFLWLQERGKSAELADSVATVEGERDNERRVRTRATAEADRLRRSVAQLEGTLQKVSTPELKLATVKSNKGVVLKILIDPLTGNWYVMAFELPDAASDRDYQLWFVDKKNPDRPVPSELFRPGRAGSLEAVTQVPAGVEPVGAAISLEPKGGSTSGSPTEVIMGGPLL
ncbi:MAG TPA: anti-sigma factor [Kofleriaceae bacterium]|nr:anti-sigma factor [Kofleriaceae bacterium]